MAPGKANTTTLLSAHRNAFTGRPIGRVQNPLNLQPSGPVTARLTQFLLEAQSTLSLMTRCEAFLDEDLEADVGPNRISHKRTRHETGKAYTKVLGRAFGKASHQQA